MTTVTAIADAAFDAVNSAITDVIKTCTVTKTTQGAYSATTGAHSTTTSQEAGRAVRDESRPIADIFPAYEAGPTDKLYYLEGLTAAPAENDTLTIGGSDMTITQVGDVAGAGTFFAVVAR